MKEITLLIAFINLAINSFSQNVGIGLTTPAAKLQINSTSTALRPLLLLSDSIFGISNTIEFGKQGISNRWSLSSFPQGTGNTSFLRFGFSGGVTPFTLIGDGRVGINNINPATSLDVNSNASQTSIFNGGSQMYISLAEQGNFRGYIGSYSGNPEDVDFGTYGTNETGKVHLTAGGNVPRLTVTPNGNIGLGTQNPAEKLDVNGSINVSQTIKANGVAGQPGQVLSLNSNGNIAWGDFNEFKNHRTFNFQQGATQWTVPAGVTRIMVEAWGAGGGGSIMGSGAGGGYACGSFSVIAGDIISFTIGYRGVGGSGAAGGQDGGDTFINTPTGSVNAFGGEATTSNNGIGFIGKGGLFDVGIKGMGAPGEDGQPNRIEYYQSSATTFLEATIGGKGGNAGNTLYTGATGGYRLYNSSTATQIKMASPRAARHPGGGGGGHYNGSEIYCSGADGLIVIHY